MEFDKIHQEFVLNVDDRRAMGHPHLPLEERLPLTSLEYLLDRAQTRLVLTSQIDPSEFPAGARKNELLAQQQKYGDTLRNIIAGLVTVAEASVVAGFEELLRAQGEQPE
jgi:hypothetical protein